MDGKKIGIAVLAVSLTAETITKHIEVNPHTHFDCEQRLNYMRSAFSVYGIPYNQFPEGNTFTGFPTLEVLKQIKIINPF